MIPMDVQGMATDPSSVPPLTVMSAPPPPGDDRLVADYLRAEYTDTQPASTRSFLLRASILDEFCAELCDAVLHLRCLNCY